MYPVPPRFLEAIANPVAIRTRVEVWRSGARVDPFGDEGLPVYGGNVDVDGSKQVRRQLTNVSVDATDAMWDLLSPLGTRLRVFRGFRYLNRETDMVPVGHFVLDDLTENYGGDWDGQIGTASDLMLLVQRAKFPVPRVFDAGVRQLDVLVTLLQEVLGPVAVLTDSPATLASPLLAERDRGKAISDLATALGVDVLVAPDGTPTVRPVPVLGASVWSVMPGDGGTLYSATRSRTLTKTYSAVSASAGGISGERPFDPQVVRDDNPDSPTYYLGPFGEVTYFMSSEFFTSPEQASNAARARLAVVSGPQSATEVVCEPNPALADGDTITVAMPRRGRGQQPVIEQQLVGSFTVPLTVGGTQRITTRNATAVEDSD